MPIENIVLPDPKVILTNQSIFTLKNLVSLQMNFNLTGGSFLANVLKGSISNLTENLAFTLPNGRVVTLKQVGSSQARGGLVQTVGGPAVSPTATMTGWVASAPGVNQYQFYLASYLARGIPIFWETSNWPIKGFSYRGPILSGIQQLASIILGEVIVRNDGIHIVNPGAIPYANNPFKVPTSDIVSISQVEDYSLDVLSELNPALFLINFNDPGDFIYDADHAQQQPPTIVQAGTGNAGFIPIPDGWLVEGTYEEWTPVPGSGTVDNPNQSVGRYWKQFPSPTVPGNMRGITDFTRLVKDLRLPGNVSTFVGSPITEATGGQSGLANTFQFLGGDTENGIYGFNVDDTVVQDIISDQYLEIQSSLALYLPGGQPAGDASLNFYSLQLQFWTFPRVLPVTFPVGDPTNPFGIPPNVVVINPSSQVNTGTGPGQYGYYDAYGANFKKINSPRLRTTLACVYRGTMPQPGDPLSIVGSGNPPAAPSGVDQPDCGRIGSVGLTLSRSGIILNIMAEQYDFSNDGNLSGSGPGSTVAE